MNPIQQGSIFSACGKFRLSLTRLWNPGKPLLPFVLLNPSKAGRLRPDGREAEDPTSRKAIGFAQRLGYGGMVLVNLYDYCATRPRELKAAGYPVSPANDAAIRASCEEGDGIVICGWGANARGLSRPAEVTRMLQAWGFRTMALRLLADGTPEHPLMLPYTCSPVQYRA